MRIALILLSILALVFIGSISWSLIGQGGGLASIKKSTSSTPSGDSLVIETWKNQIKTDEKIEKLSSLVSELAEKNGIQNTGNNTGQLSTESGSTVSVKVSGKLLSMLMPTVTLTEIPKK